MSKFSKSNMTLCFDCKNATRPWKCPWVNDFTPVAGWVAKATTVSKGSVIYDSFDVDECPLFDRDGIKGGVASADICVGKKREYPIDDKDTVTLAEAVIERAIEDWKITKYGALTDDVTCAGDKVKVSELLEFFFSDWFEVLLGSFSQRTPEQIRRFIGITEDMRPEGVS